MSIGRICVREVDTVDSNESVTVAAERMHDRAVGTLVVVNSAAEPVGILTDRDLVSRVLAKGRIATETPVVQVMTPAPKTISEQAPIESALSLMRSGRFRRLPVVGPENQLVGLVSLDDILMLLAEEFGQIGQLLERETPRGVIEGMSSTREDIARLQNESRLSQGA
jgi:CBS domain-containing protein